MKIWIGHGSEHSMNLVMIGWFKDAGKAASAKQAIDRLVQQVNADIDAGLLKVGERTNEFTGSMLKTLEEVKLYSVLPAEMEQFAYDVGITVKENQVVLTTEESDVSAFLKLLLDKGARLEVYSAHEYPESEHGRGR